MPTATAARRKKSGPAMVDPIAVAEFVEQQPSAPPFNPFDEQISFFNAINMIADNEWDRYELVLYRLDPQVRNESERAWIHKYQHGIDEQVVFNDEGGGKFMLILHDLVEKPRPGVLPSPPPRERKHKFRISGEPKLQRGQRLVGGSQTAVADGRAPDAIEPARAGSSDVAVLANVLKELIEHRGSGDTGNSQVLELMGQANKSAISIVTEAARQTVTSSTGSAIGDKLLERLLDSKFGGKSSEDGLRDKLAMLAIERLSNPQPAESKDPLSQLAFVKELTGVESIAELLRPSGGGDAWKSKLVDMGVNLIGALPQLFQLFIANQNAAFQRQIQIEQFRRQPQPIALPADGSTTAPRIQVQPGGDSSQPSAAEQPAGEIPVNLFNPAQMALDEIVVDFNEGLDGQLTARLVRQRYAQVVESMRPMLANMEQVILFAQNTPPLSEIAGEEEFPEFLQQFCNEILHPEAEGDDDGKTTA